LPDTISQIFNRKRKSKNSKSTWRLYDNKACLKAWLIRNSIKFYNKLGFYLRIETTINDPKSLGLEKPVINLREYLTFGARSNSRVIDCFADVDPTCISSEESIILNNSIKTEKGQTIAAPDLRKTRQVALLRELLKPKYCAFNFRTRLLLKNLSEFFQNLTQIRYELIKLRARGLIKKHKIKSL